MFTPSDLKDDIDLALDVLAEWDKQLPAMLKGTVPFTRRLGRMEKQWFFMTMLRQFPPEPFVNEQTGETVVISAWSLAMQISEGGREELRELEEAFRPVVVSPGMAA